MKKVAIIIGSEGQDGRLLKLKLESLNYNITGIKKGDIDLLSSIEVSELVKNILPDEIYYLAAYHHSSQDIVENSAELFKKSIDINSVSVINFLDAIFNYHKKCRFFYASSCLIFKGSKNALLTESSQCLPDSHYAISKMTGSSFVRFYREYKKIFACSGILFNHESPLRSDNYLSKKITSYIAKLNDNNPEKLSLGGLNIAVDWGYAPDYVDAIWRVMQTEYPDDFIIATGVKKTIKDFVKTAFEHVNLDYRDYIFIDSNVLNRKNNIRIGSPKKLIKTTGWSPSINFEEMVRKLVDNELEKFKTYKEK